MVRMYGSDYSFIPGARVRLRGTVDPSIYGDYACTGNEGVIEDRRKDRYGLPEVYIQWDKNHWAYNGVMDCWTFEDHFELVEDKMASKEDQVQKLLSMLAEGLTHIVGDEAPEEEKPTERMRNRLLDAMQPFQQEESRENEEFTHALEAATAKLGESEAFIIIGLDHNDHPQAPQGILEPYAMGYSKSSESEILLTAHMARVAANAHQNLAIEMVTQMAEE